MPKKKLFFKKFINKFGLILVLILGLILRIHELGKRDFWYDEAFTGIAVKESFPAMMKMIINDVHPPLYYALLKPFAAFFDYSVSGIRLFSVVFGVLGIVAVYYFARELFYKPKSFGKRVALLAAFLTAVSPFAIQYSKEARMYSMFVFFAVSSGYFFIRALKKGRTKNFLLWGLFLGLSALTHYMGVVFSAVFYLVYLISNFSRDNILKKKAEPRMLINRIWPSKNLMLGYFAAFLVFLPWIFNFINHLRMVSTKNLEWIESARLYDVFMNLEIFLLGTPLGEMSSGMPNPNQLYGADKFSVMAILVIFLTLISLFLIKKEKERAVMALAFSIGFVFLVYVLSLFGQDYFVARYLLPGAYFTFVLLAAWLARLKAGFAYLALGVYLFLILTIDPLGYSTGWNVFEKKLDKYDGKEFYILNPFDYVIAKYYLGADRLILYNVDWPPYNPDYWAAIGKNLRRTENFSDLKNNPNSLIISNTQLKGQDNKNFDPTGLEKIDEYDNILIYRFSD